MAKKAVVKKAAKKVAKKEPAKVALSGADIEKQLALAHKIIASAGAQVNYMLSTRRLNMNRIIDATEATTNAANHMQRLVKLLKGEK